MRIETDRLLIRPFIPEDLTDLHAILGDDETMRHVEAAFTPEKTREFLETFCISRRGAAAAVEKVSGRVIGYILFKAYEPDVYEIGWIFHRAVWRQGYAFESCRAVIAYAFTALNAQKIFAEATDGVKSVGLMKKLGMRPEGIQRGHTRNQAGRWCDLYLYGLLRDEYHLL